MRLLQLNLWGGRLDTPILKLIEAQDPDILCLQEAIDLKGGELFFGATTEEIQDVIKAKHIFMSPTFSLRHMKRRADFGNCIISKYPIAKTETIFTGKKYIADFDLLKHSPNMRNLQKAVLSLPGGRSLNVLNHHGHHIHQHKKGDPETIRQCQLIAEEIKKVDGSLILSGDFNLEPHSQSLELINGLLTNLPLKAKLKTTRTLLTHKTEVCDYIFVNNQIKVKSFKALEDIVSDHQALILDFDLV